MILLWLAVAIPGSGPAAAVAPPLRAQQWVARYNDRINDLDQARAVGVSSDGSTVYVTGESMRFPDSMDWITVAYDAVTGTQKWVARYNSPGNDNDRAFALAVTPDGSKVFVTGQAGPAYTVVAYDALTGKGIWVSRSTGRNGGFAVALAVSPDSETVFATGVGGGVGGGDFTTVAYDAASGAKRWTARYNGTGNGYEQATAVAVSPDGATVFVTGPAVVGPGTTTDFATLAYVAATGAQRWVASYDGPANSYDNPYALAVSPDGTRVFVTGEANTNGLSSGDFATVAYEAADGSEQWTALYDGPTHERDVAIALTVSPDGRTVVVTGTAAVSGIQTDPNYATVAYATAAGSQQWVTQYQGLSERGGVAADTAMSPDGNSVFVAGSSAGSDGSDDYATVAYDMAGTQQWVARYGSPAAGSDTAWTLGLSPDGSKMFVTGEIGTGNGDYGTVAYSLLP